MTLNKMREEAIKDFIKNAENGIFHGECIISSEDVIITVAYSEVYASKITNVYVKVFGNEYSWKHETEHETIVPNLGLLLEQMLKAENAEDMKNLESHYKFTKHSVTNPEWI